MKKILILLVCITLLIPAAGCAWAVRIADRAAVGPGQTFNVNDHGELDLDGVNSIRIVTVSDNAILLSGGSQAVATLKGQCRSATKPEWLDARKDGDTVVFEVKYPVNTMSSTTVLTVTIPESFRGSLSVTTVSGGIIAENLPQKLGQVNLGSVSGKIQFSAAAFERLEAGTVSGEMDLTGIAAPVTAKTISGDISLDYAAFAETKATTVSGSVRADIAKDTAFRVDFGTVSGHFQSDYPALQASANGAFSGGTSASAAAIAVNTTSGSFEIHQK